jgi:hypothetical protein
MRACPPTPCPPGRRSRSRDGEAALLTFYLRLHGSTKLLDSDVELIKRVVHSGAPPGLQAKVTGPGGVSYDASQVFKSINGKLLLVTVLLVFVLLILIYRSPIFWAIPLLSVGLAEAIAEGVGYLLTQLGVTINSQSAGILTVLVFGTGTDYALLLVARYREELRHHASSREAMAIALRRAGPVIFASASTVILASAVRARRRGQQHARPGTDLGDRRRARDALHAHAAAVAAADLRAPRVLAVHPARRLERRRRDARALAARRRARRAPPPRDRRRDDRCPRGALHRPDEPRHQPQRQQRLHRRGRIRAGPDAARRALPAGRQLAACRSSCPRSPGSLQVRAAIATAPGVSRAPGALSATLVSPITGVAVFTAALAINPTSQRAMSLIAPIRAARQGGRRAGHADRRRDRSAARPARRGGTRRPRDRAADPDRRDARARPAAALARRPGAAGRDGDLLLRRGARRRARSRSATSSATPARTRR